MARTDTLTNFLTDIATAIRAKTGKTATIKPETFDTEIESIETSSKYKPLFFSLYSKPSSITVSPDDVDLSEVRSVLSMFCETRLTNYNMIKSFLNNACQAIGNDYITSLSNFAKYMGGNFSYNTGLQTETFDFSIFNTSKITDFSYAFYCIFGGDSYLNIIGLDSLDMSSCQNLIYAFYGLKKTLGHIGEVNAVYDFSGWNFSAYANGFKVNFNYAFANTGQSSALSSANKKGIELLFKNWTFPDMPDSTVNSNKSVILQYAFSNINANKIDLSGWHIGKNITVNFDHAFYQSKFFEIIFTSGLPVSSLYYAFYGVNLIENLDLSDLTMIGGYNSNLIDCSYAFYTAKSIKSITMPFFDSDKILSNVSYISFSNCFYSVYTLESIDFSTVGTISFVNTFQNLCCGCKALKEFKTNEQTFTATSVDMSYMFRDCAALTELDLSKWKCSTISTINYAFYGCTSLQKLNVSGFSFSTISSNRYSNMLSSVPTNCEIIVKDDTEKAWFNSKFAAWTNVKTPDELS